MSSKSKAEKRFNMIDAVQQLSQTTSSWNPLKDIKPAKSAYKAYKYFRFKNEDKLRILQDEMTLSIDKIITKVLELNDTNKEFFVDTKEVLDRAKVLFDIVEDYYYDFEGAINRANEKFDKKKELSRIEQSLIHFYERYTQLKFKLIAHNDRIAVQYTSFNFSPGKFLQIQETFAADNNVEGDYDKDLRYIARPKGSFLIPRLNYPDNSQLLKEARERQNTLPEHGFYLGQKLGVKGLRFKELDLDDYPKQKDKYEFLKVKSLETTLPDASYEKLDEFVNEIKVKVKQDASIVIDEEKNGGIRKRITRKGRKRQLRKKYSKTKKYY